MTGQLLGVPTKFLQMARIGLAVRHLKKTTEEDQVYAQQVLANLLGEARGAAMKVGQLMAGNGEKNPFQALVTSISPLPLTRILPILETAINQPIPKIFKAFHESKAAASLGQVHHAILDDGTEVAVKVRYPGIVEAVKAELKLVSWMPSAGPFKRWKFDSTDYKNILHRQLLRETDYSIEAQTQQRFKQKMSIPGLYIPKVYQELCNESVLVQSWETGCQSKEASSWSKKDRLEIGRTLLMTLFQSLFVHGEVHGDPHPGNYMFRHDEQGNPITVLLDYGCTVLITKPRRLALLKLLDSYHQNADIDPLQYFSTMGFSSKKLEYINDKLPALCEILFHPFIVQRPFDTAQWQLSEKLNKLLEEQRWWFRAAGPADLMLLLRAFQGLNQQLIQLDIALPWWPLLEHVVGNQLIEEARALEITTTLHKPKTNNKLTGNARKLRVLISENDGPDTTLDFPAEAAIELDTIMPESILTEIQCTTDFNFAKFTHRIRREGIRPQLVFESAKGLKKYRVWLE